MNVDACATARTKVVGLQVYGPVLGRSHAFQHNKRSVEVSIPSVKLAADLEVTSPGDEVTFSGGLAENPTLETSTYYVNEIEISMQVSEFVSIPAEMLRTSPKRPELAGPELAGFLEELALDYERRLADVLGYWERVVSWISGGTSVGLPGVRVGRETSARLEGMALTQCSDGHRFWIPTHSVAFYSGAAINPEQWDAIDRALTSGSEQPIWFRYLDVAKQNARSWKYEDAIVACAIAAETLAREVFWLSSGANPSPAARDIMDGVNVRAIISRWQKLTGITKTIARLSEVNQLFDLRNAIMHVGETGEKLTRERAYNYLGAASDFIFAGDEWVYEYQGIANPRLYPRSAELVGGLTAASGLNGLRPE